MSVPSPDVTIFFKQSPVADADIALVVTLPTFRRPEHVVETLKTIILQKPAAPFAVVVMENDADGQAGARAAMSFLSGQQINCIVLIAHNRGNCHAYNAGWLAAVENYSNLKAIAVIDDDELASSDWLTRLVSVQKNTGASFVGGPQRPICEVPGRENWLKHPVFSPHYETTGPVPILYSSGNVLITRPVLDAMPFPYLDPSFNFTGGGDSDFYRRSRLKGFTFAWSAEAAVDETVPLRRTEHAWIKARSLRTGALSAMIEHRENPDALSRLKTVVKSVALLGASPLRGIKLWRKTGLTEAGLFHFYVAIGRLMAEFGLINEQYRHPEKN
ncbi:glycosyltransferase family 2 protein [Pararhizobium sp.]|uniref:glycosyltransferase family 2 protein n=1 Tax=Pararhizobium sp. TaxID=1977563 RepID=UPI00271C67F7|nr:glycosyltransferase family A protein [Pararhizobium sp.]MDO9418263.1 glycosyltransferase family A protein [Pararhizobium sp.]